MGRILFLMTSIYDMAKEYIFMDMIKIYVQVKLPVYALLYVREHVEQSEGAIQSHFSSSPRLA